MRTTLEIDRFGLLRGDSPTDGKIRASYLASNERKGTWTTLDACRFRSTDKRNEKEKLLASGFLRDGRAKRMTECGIETNTAPYDVRTRPGFILPVSLSYPLLGCTSAAPNSVSPSNRIIGNKQFRGNRSVQAVENETIENRHKRLPGREIENRQKRLPAPAPETKTLNPRKLRFLRV